MQQRMAQRAQMMRMLWSGVLALWHDRTRRGALPLLLASLLLLAPPMPARSDCSCDGDERPQIALPHHHEAHHHEGEESRSHSTRSGSPSLSSPSWRRNGHVNVGAASQTANLTVATCCSCPRAPLGAPVVATFVPTSVHIDSQALVYVRASALPVYRFDTLTGLFGRAGPPPNSKPKPLFLASLSGRAPPVSL